MTPKIHNFSSTESAYNASQCDENIKDGDILVTPETVGVLVGAWPVHVSGPVGEFHELEEFVTWDSLDGGKYANSYRIAMSAR